MGDTYKMVNKPLYKKWWFYIALILIFIFFIFIIPIIINELYKLEDGYITLWDATDVLSFYSVVLSGLITILALIMTIYYSKKDTKKQIDFYMSQTESPFFMVKKVCVQDDDSRIFKKVETGWTNQYRVNLNDRYYKEKQDIIKIIIENIGNGIAIELSSQVDTFPSSLISQVIRKDDSISLKYDLKEVISKNLPTINTSKEYKSFVNLNYKNILGKEFTQVIDIALIYSFESYMLTISVNEVSCQKFNI